MPDVLLSGDHKKISQWRLEQSEERTKLGRPDLYKVYSEKQYWINKLLKKGKVLYIDTIESLRRGKGEIIHASKKGIVVCDAFAKVVMVTAFEDVYAQEMVAYIPKVEGQWQFVIHQGCLI